jgi:hypothetical protein
MGKLTYPRLAVSLGVVVVAAALVGAYPTWRFGGWSGLVVAGLALGINGLVFLPAAWLVRRTARRGGTAAAARALMSAGLARVVLVVLLGLAAERAVGSARLLLWLWVLGLYFLMALGEAYWAGQGLGRSRPAGGDNRRGDAG